MCADQHILHTPWYPFRETISKEIQIKLKRSFLAWSFSTMSLYLILLCVGSKVYPHKICDSPFCNYKIQNKDKKKSRMFVQIFL